ncbi:hypothetical protein MLD38_005665 [Melastoma candidum]|uniref:Uncharacterized protein n=1 Tax=Melastoma candidum TaxID=119954 RepID=A0ACB9RPJ0_9MYRT|nr:hypothetical protein MLD38_005665 [Melastoma candidum]
MTAATATAGSWSGAMPPTLLLPGPRFLPARRATSAAASSLPQRPLRCAVLGAGFAGLSVVYHLLKESPAGSHLSVDIYDKGGVGAGASGISGGLVHPYSPKVKPLWLGEECWEECLKLLGVAQTAIDARKSGASGSVWYTNCRERIIRRRGIIRPAVDVKNLDILSNNASNCLPSCVVERVDRDAAQNLLPNLVVPYGSAFYMPDALSIWPLQYLQAILLACKDLVEENRASSIGAMDLNLNRKSVDCLHDIEGEYDAVIICLGAESDLLPELSGKLPLRTCRGVIAHMQLPTNTRECYPDQSPSILSDAWLAVQGPKDLCMGSTWEWRSRNYSAEVSEEESSRALQELLPKASVIYPKIKDWTFEGARAGVRAMPPNTTLGSLPLLGCIDDLVQGKPSCRYWLFAGLGARGLLFHAFLGKLMAQAVRLGCENVLPPELTSWKRKQR